MKEGSNQAGCLMQEEMLGGWAEHRDNLLSSPLLCLKSFGKHFDSILTNAYIVRRKCSGRQGMFESFGVKTT